MAEAARWCGATYEPSRFWLCLGRLALARSGYSSVASSHQITLAGIVPPIARGLFEPASVVRGY